jgi:hypothetical protein
MMHAQSSVIKKQWNFQQTIKWDKIKSLNKRLNYNGINKSMQNFVALKFLSNNNIVVYRLSKL